MASTYLFIIGVAGFLLNLGVLLLYLTHQKVLLLFLLYLTHQNVLIWNWVFSHEISHPPKVANLDFNIVQNFPCTRFLHKKCWYVTESPHIGGWGVGVGGRSGVGGEWWWVVVVNPYDQKDF